MAVDPVLLLARQRVIKASADLEVQLAFKQGSAPTLIIMRNFRDDAANSLAALALEITAPLERLRELQAKVTRYDDFVKYASELISDGKQYDREITAQESEEFLDILTGTPEGQQEAIDLGLIDGISRQDG